MSNSSSKWMILPAAVLLLGTVAFAQDPSSGGSGSAPSSGSGSSASQGSSTPSTAPAISVGTPSNPQALCIIRPVVTAGIPRTGGARS